MDVYGNRRQLLVERLPQHLPGAVGTAAAAGGDTEFEAQLLERDDTLAHGGPDLAITDGIADADVHRNPGADPGAAWPDGAGIGTESTRNCE